MKLIEKADATASLAQHATEVENGPVIVTDHGNPVAALVPLENSDLETVALSTSPQFLSLIERSRSRAAEEGTLSNEQMRAKF
jgi:antitoxin (DNA-binding transcriptional repressor) of toxin-antitoxin stability system